MLARLHSRMRGRGFGEPVRLMVDIEGEAMRPVTWVRIKEVEQGDWAIGGKQLTAADVHATACKKKVPA